jgi:hypothetical protein
MFKRFAWVVVLIVFMACDQSPPSGTTNPNGNPVKGEISGKISFADAGSAANFANAEFVPGEVSHYKVSMCRAKP